MLRLLLIPVLSIVLHPLVGAQERGRDHWAFRPLTQPPLPAGDAGSPVDRFLRAGKYRWAPEADRYQLVRRLHLDLTGLPPTPADLLAFVRDQRPDAYERLVDRLLASPHFGERWGRHWLDAAGYVDVIGGDNDAGIVKLGERRWLYRDWVIRATNDDQPFDQFLTDQLAGDELADWRSSFTPSVRERLIATGFLRASADDTDENELNTLDIRHGVLQRTVEIAASNLLALTVNCAKCHDHKYEPISQKDYYRLIAVMQPAFNPANWLQPKQRLLPELPGKEREAVVRRNAEIVRGQEGRERVRGLVKRLGFEPIVDVLTRQINDLGKQRRPLSYIHAVYDAGPPTPTRLLKRGDHLSPAEEIRPGFPRVLSVSDSAADMTPASVAGSSGRRLALAKWLTAPGTAAEGLVLRVRVNRVWRHLFGAGIVESADNFGVTGAPPTHPELLEWLACEFRAGGQCLKPLVRTLVLSAAYRQQRPPRRVESEVVRDGLLCAGDSLDARLGGEPVHSDVRPDSSIAVRGDGSAMKSRRSVYVLHRRNYHPTLLNVFDQPTVATNCLGRQPSAVVLQSLTMLNDAVVREQAERFAARVRRESCDDPARQVEAAFLIVLSRPPKPREAEICRDFLQRHGLMPLCHTLLNTTEFLYVP